LLEAQRFGGAALLLDECREWLDGHLIGFE